MKKNILIVCLFFPPSPSIGGRRSAKFAKYLAKKGYDIHVIQAENVFPNTSPWFKDIEATNINRHVLPLNYPREFVLPVKSLLQKVKYRLINLYFSIFHPQKNRFDYSFFWERQFLKKAESLIVSHNIKNIFVSGPPFYYSLYTVKLKEKYPYLNIILDFRDPWIDSPYYGLSILNPKQKQYEIDALNKVYKSANYFTAPNTFLLSRQKEYILPELKEGAKLVELPHAYDIEEVSPYIQKVPCLGLNGKIKFVYGGQLYTGTGDVLKALNDTLDNIKINDVELYNTLEFEFYTPDTDKAELFTNHKEIVFFHKPIGNKIMSKIADSTFVLIILAHHNKDFRTTKFLEYAVLRRPFLVFGEKGHVADFVEENNLGRAFDKESLISGDLILFLKKYRLFINENFNKEFDFSEYEYETITNRLDKLLLV